MGTELLIVGVTGTLANIVALIGQSNLTQKVDLKKVLACEKKGKRRLRHTNRYYFLNILKALKIGHLKAFISCLMEHDNL